MARKKIIGVILFVFILFAFLNGFRQYYLMTLDGDIAESVLPYPGVQKTFDDPTGIKTIVNNDKHLGPNRFFSYYFLHKTFREVPLLLQNFCEPIDSVYYTAAIVKLLMHIMLLCLFVGIINGNFKLFSLKFLVTAVILTSFFQINGKQLAQITIIDKSVTYCFFYAVPLIFLLIYYLPLFLELLHGKKMKMNLFMVFLWSICAIISCFSGPVMAPTILIANFILFLFLYFSKTEKQSNISFFKKILKALHSISTRHYLFLIPISFLALYSTFLGTFNDAYQNFQLPLKDLYLLLLEGIWKVFLTSTVYPIILVLLVGNYFIVFYKYKNNTQYKKIIDLYRFLIVFSLIYILLLPFGGYRPYRTYILRHDSILPITALSIITVCYTFLFLYEHLKMGKWKYRIIYFSICCVIFVFFTWNNKIRNFNECEKASLYFIAQSKENVVALDNDCCVIGWEVIDNPQQSKNYAELIYFWNITDTVKFYYNSSQPK